MEKRVKVFKEMYIQTLQDEVNNFLGDIQGKLHDVNFLVSNEYDEPAYFAWITFTPQKSDDY